MLLLNWKVFCVAATFITFLNCTDANLWQHLNQSLTEPMKIINFLLQAIFNSSVRICVRATNKGHERIFFDSLDTILSRQRGIPIDLYAGENLHYQIRSRLYFVDSFEALRSLVEDERPVHGTTPTYNFYTIVLPPNIKDPLPIIEQMVKFCWTIHMVNVNIIVEDKGSIVNLYTYFPFTPQSCENIVPVVYKRFDVIRAKFRRFPLFAHKIKNLQGCPLNVVAWQKPPFIMLNYSRVGLFEPLSGVDGEILKMISKAFNFTIAIVPPPRRSVMSTESAEVVKILHDNKASIAIGNLRCSYKLTSLILLSDPYYMSNIRILLRIRDAFTPLEMLFLPFDLYSWLMIGTFFIGRRIFRQFSTKSNRKTNKNSLRSRMSIAVYLFTYLMIRSAYEGSVFNFLHKRPMKACPVSLDEAIKAGYRFLVDYETYSNMEVSAELNASLIVLNVSESSILTRMHLYKGKIGTFFLEDYITRYVGKTVKYPYIQRYELIQENIFSKLACMYLPKFSYFYLYLNQRLLRMRSHGLVQKFYSDFVNVKILRNKYEIDDRIIREKPTTLGMQEVKGAFEMYFILKGLCGIVFLLEVAVKRWRKLRVVMEVFH